MQDSCARSVIAPLVCIRVFSDTQLRTRLGGIARAWPTQALLQQKPAYNDEAGFGSRARKTFPFLKGFVCAPAPGEWFCSGFPARYFGT